VPKPDIGPWATFGVRCARTHTLPPGGRRHDSLHVRARNRAGKWLRPEARVLRAEDRWGTAAEQGQASGPAAIGVVLKDHEYRDVVEVFKRIGWARNHHEAEYKALIEGLGLARRHGIDRIRVFLDSALVVNTVNGDWNLEPEHLKGLCTKACLLVQEFADVKVSWVPREMNVEADALACRARGRGR